jgi:hypothetical protein
VVDVGLVRVIKREDGLALAFSVSFVERVVRAVRRGWFYIPGSGEIYRGYRARWNGKLTCTRFDDIALIWLRGSGRLEPRWGFVSGNCRTTRTRDYHAFRSRAVHFHDPPRPHRV